MDAAVRAVVERAPARPPDPASRLALLAALAPAPVLGARALLGRLGANPVEAVQNQLGWCALVLLLSSLACTPLHEVAGWGWPLRVRRTLGLAAFAWALLHVCFYAGVDQGLDLGAIWDDVRKHRFVFFGAGAFVLLVPLALTSTRRSVRRLGFRRWKALHRLVYLGAALAGLHYLWRFKLVEPGPVLALSLLALLLFARVAGRVRSTRKASRALRAEGAAPPGGRGGACGRPARPGPA